MNNVFIIINIFMVSISFVFLCLIIREYLKYNNQKATILDLEYNNQRAIILDIFNIHAKEIKLLKEINEKQNRNIEFLYKEWENIKHGKNNY